MRCLLRVQYAFIGAITQLAIFYSTSAIYQAHSSLVTLAFRHQTQILLLTYLLTFW